MKILMAAAEAVPFAKTGGLADVAGALPLALEAQGQDIIMSLPFYKVIKNSSIKIQVSKEGYPFSVIGRGIKVYFIEHDGYFNRDGLYGDKKGDYPDNLERFAYYSRNTLELLKKINFKADIIHLHDWQACLIPVYLKTTYEGEPFYKDINTLLTIHNIGYQGLFPKEEFPKLGLDWNLFNMETLEFYDKINFLKGGIVFSDIINTVSPTYSKEIQTKEFGYGMEGILVRRRDSLFGILNGLDYSIWNPETDKFITAKFSEKDISAKELDKADLQKICHLPLKKDIPLLGIVSRLAEQKGFDILAEAIEKICRMDLQLVILGTGDLKYHQLLESMAKKYPKVISLHLKFDDPLAHKIYAGSDIFVMPSKYEPCGLGQLISFRYGALPLVFKTGGLADTVNDKNGFVFDRYSKDALIKTIEKARSAFKDKNKWAAFVKAAMKYDFSWAHSSEQYIGLYEKARSK